MGRTHPCSEVGSPGDRVHVHPYRTALARIGGRSPTPGALTATERKVAELVADGYTNREVADRLFLSVKTVAGHLTRIYTKLGVRSRTELSRQMRTSSRQG